MVRLGEGFDASLVTQYPRSARRLRVRVRPYGLRVERGGAFEEVQCSRISPHGIEFQSSQELQAGDLLKIDVDLPDYWRLKKRFVHYGHVDAPQYFCILVRVVQLSGSGRGSRPRKIIAQTVNMDPVDEQVLRTYLQDSKR